MKSKITSLESKILRARDRYYNGDPEVSDQIFDAWIDELMAIDPNNKAITMVGAPIDNSPWEKITHPIVMGSLDKAKNTDELTKWMLHTFVPGNSVCIVDKLDGISVLLSYRDGKLVSAGSRGNSEVGENITRNVIKMQGVRTTLPVSFTGSLRGEIILKREKLATLFPEQLNARNTAGGIAKRLSGEDCQHLDILFYQAVGDIELLSEYLQLKFLEDELKLNVPNYKAFVGKSVNDLIDFVIDEYNEYQAGKREALPYECDGIVVRVNDLAVQNELGFHNGRPRGAVALKFDADAAISIVREIPVQAGNSGRQTPVAIIDPVFLSGAEVRRASLYNFAYINELGIDIGAEVLVCRSGDVIPRVKEVITDTGTIFKTPTTCSACGEKVVMDGENLICTNVATCPSQVSGRIKNWIKDLNILEWGNTLVERLVESGKVGTIADLYHITLTDLASMERMGDKSAQNCYHSLWSHNPVPLDIILGALSIPMIGSSSIRLCIDNGYDTLEKILAMSKEELLAIKGFGPERSRSLYDGLKKYAPIIEGLLEAGLKIERKKIMAKGNKLNGMNVCITGTLSRERKEFEDIIKANGGEFKKAVNKSTTLLIIADPDSNTTKAQAARDLGVKLISEDDFMSMIDD